MKKIHVLMAGLLLVCFIPVFANASTVKRTGSNVSLSAEEAVEGNFYAVGNAVDITGVVDGDAVVIGGNITSVGTISEDGLVLGGTVSVGGTVGDDLRIVAGEVTVSGVVKGSLTVIGGRVKILSTATIGGDVMVYGGEVVVEGKVDGFLYGTIDSLRVNGVVASGIDVTTSKLEFGSNTAVGGNVTYISSQDLVRASEAQITGEIVKNSPATVGDTDFSFKPLVVQFLILLFTTLVFYLVARRRFERFVAYPMFNQHSVLKAILFGFIFLFLPVAIGVLLVSVLGSLLGVMALLTYVILLVFAIPLMPYVIAKLSMKAFGHKHLKLLHIVLGSVSVIAFIYVPLIGFFLIFGLYIFTLGTILSILFARFRN